MKATICAPLFAKIEQRSYVDLVSQNLSIEYNRTIYKQFAASVTTSRIRKFACIRTLRPLAFTTFKFNKTSSKAYNNAY